MENIFPKLCKKMRFTLARLSNLVYFVIDSSCRQFVTPSPGLHGGQNGGSENFSAAILNAEKTLGTRLVNLGVNVLVIFQIAQYLARNFKLLSR